MPQIPMYHYQVAALVDRGLIYEDVACLLLGVNRKNLNNIRVSRRELHQNLDVLSHINTNEAYRQCGLKHGIKNFCWYSD